jgi:hypothetical protein
MNKVMDKDEVLRKLERIDNTTAKLQIFSGFFDKEINLLICSMDSTEKEFILSDYLYSCILDLVDLKYDDNAQFLEDIYKFYKTTIKNSSYGIVPGDLLAKYNGDEGKANQEFFNLNTKEEVFNDLTFNYAMIVQYSNEIDSNEPRYLGFFFNRKWDDEHELQIEFENGKYKQVL